MSWYNTIEFYVISGAVAAGAVALAALPQRTGRRVQHLLAGTLSQSTEPQPPGIDLTVDDNRRLILRRTGLPAGITECGAVSLSVGVQGFDIVIDERIVYDRSGSTPVDTATFVLDFLAPERYHIRYNSDETSSFTAFTIPIREGIHMRRDLK